MPNSRELRAERANLHTRMTEIVDRAESENRNLSGEESAEFTRIHNEQNDLLARIERMEQLEVTRAELDAVAAPQNGGSRAPVGGAAGFTIATPVEVDQEARLAEHRRVFGNYLRLGLHDMAPEDRVVIRGYFNALQTTSGTAGGYLVPPAFRGGVVEAMKSFGGMRTVATVITTTEGQDLPFATNDDTGNVGEILSEGATASEQDVSFGVRVLKAYMYSTKVVRVSFQLLNDSAFDLEGFLRRTFATRLGRITNTHYTTGTGVNQPQGIATESTSGVTAAAQAAITFDELTDLEHSVDPSYRAMPGTRWMFHDNTLRELKQLKDGNGNYLWSAGTQSGEPDRLKGYAYVINQDVAQMATGTKAVFFGDLSSYYVRDVDGMMVLRLEELYALQAQVAFVGFMRTDGGLIDAGQNPVKHITMA